MRLPSPYLLFLGDAADFDAAKTALGLRDWSREQCVGQHRLSQDTIDIGLPDMTPAEGAAAGAKALVIGLAPFGGRISESWVSGFHEALAAGLDIVSGLHTPLSDLPGLADAAERHGRMLFDVRRWAGPQTVANGAPRSGQRLLTVGTDCALGKKYTALAITKEMKLRGMAATFRATGQTGIMIAGEGIPMDSVVSDFLAGAAEQLSPATDPGHWDVIEGQGSLGHPCYAAVSLGLLHGSQPDALVMCHDPRRTALADLPRFKIPPLREAIELAVVHARLVNERASCIGISLNTSGLNEDERKRTCSGVAEETGLPVVDPFIHGVGDLVDALSGTASALSLQA